MNFNLSEWFLNFSKNSCAPFGALPDPGVYWLCLPEADVLREKKKLGETLVADLTIKKNQFTAHHAVSFGPDTHFSVLVIREKCPPFFILEGIRGSLADLTQKTENFHADFSRLKSLTQPFVAEALGNFLTLHRYDYSTGHLARPLTVKIKDQTLREDPQFLDLSFFQPFFKKPEKKSKPSKPLTVTLITAFSEATTAFHKGMDQGSAQNLIRFLEDLPGNILTPKNYVAFLKKKLSQIKNARFQFLDATKLKTLGAGAFLAVGRATDSKDCGIVVLESDKRGKRRVKNTCALVGKGLCYDTGGYNIKTGGHMNGMHRDMSGSAAALANFLFLNKWVADVQFTAYLAILENLISPTAYRPNDVVKAMNGVTIEVADTDAEGRMALADTLALASREKPALLLDYATLTGAVIRAIDTRRSGVFSIEERTARRAVRAAEKSGERLWAFPTGQDYWRELKSDYADLRQCAETNNSDHIYAATFLSAFVEKEIAWLHIDLASHSNRGGLGLSAKPVTGVGVRMTAKIVDEFFARES